MTSKKRSSFPKLPTAKRRAAATKHIIPRGGTKPKIEITDLEVIEELAEYGLIKEEIADHLGISRDTLNEREKENPDISVAIKRGRVKALAESGKQLMKKIRAGDITAIIWAQKSLGGRRDYQCIEHTSPKEKPVLAKIELSLEQRVRIAKEFILAQEPHDLVPPTREVVILPRPKFNDEGL